MTAMINLRAVYLLVARIQRVDIGEIFRTSRGLFVT